MNIPWRWNEVLHALHDCGFPEAIIAGGALRDLDHRKTITDIDVFVAAKRDNERLMLERAFGYGGVSIFEMDEAKTKEEYPGWNQSVCGVYNFPYRKSGSTIDDSGQAWLELQIYGADLGVGVGPEFQVIVVRPPNDKPMMNDDFRGFVINDFDIGLCRLSYSGGGHYSRRSGTVDFTLDYHRDYVNKTLTVLRAPNEAQLARTKKRLERLLIKYPDHTPINVHVQPETANASS